MSNETQQAGALSDLKHADTHIESSTPQGLNESHQLENITTEGTTNDDVALKVFANLHAIADEIDPHAEKRLLRKIDVHVIPLICITYLITYIDKATLSYGIIHNLLMSGMALMHRNSCSLRAL